MNVKDYLARINYSGSLKPDLKTLTDLTWAHKTSIPFTNVEYLNNQGVVDFDLNKIYQKVVAEKGVPSICYQTHRLFVWLLEQVGFQVSILLGSFFDEKRKVWSRLGGHNIPCVSISPRT